MNKCLWFAIPLIFTSCFKTAEEIKREQDVDRQLSQSSKIIADLRIEVQELKGSLTRATGQIEEIDYKTQTEGAQSYQSINERIAQLQEQVKALSEDNQMMQVQLKTMQGTLKTQKGFIKKVTGTLSEMSGKSSDSLYAEANKAFTANKQKKAKDLYLEVLAQGKISNATKNKVYYNLGLLEHWAKDYDQSLVYFSKIYTKYPRSSKAPGSLYYIGMNFKQKNETDKAKATFEELIKSYPKSVFVSKAKKEL
ncbi:MAG: hypothetical protein CME62_02045 [Halobacteriovoraceae bacterium]|nr:hypothetical protein [Halobacteriovoraceae bacterium]|tara:strand:+ start:9750 stop:10505 length:756 start_codon:yes stop_codon:yes gene_type:complete